MKRMVTFVMTVVMVSAFGLGCQKATVGGEQPGEETAMKSTETVGPEGLSAATVTIDGKSWTVEVAKTNAERIKGLGGRESIPANYGMWFLFPNPPGEVQDPFWMKDTNFDLDMVFVDQNMKVVDVKPGNKALSETLITPVAPYLYVLEMNAGEAAGIKVGDTVTVSVGPAQ
jgi:uncharacterized membrane protein (UPF0127 family)